MQNQTGALISILEKQKNLASQLECLQDLLKEMGFRAEDFSLESVKKVINANRDRVTFSHESNPFYWKPPPFSLPPNPAQNSFPSVSFQGDSPSKLKKAAENFPKKNPFG